MPVVCYRRSAIKRFIPPGLQTYATDLVPETAPAPGTITELVSAPAPGFTAGIAQVELFYKFIWTFMNKIQALVETRDNFDKPFKSRNLD